MSRLPTGRSRAVTVLAAISVTLGLWPAMGRAQTPAPEPVLDSAPKLVGFGATATIRGHLNNGSGGRRGAAAATTWGTRSGTPSRDARCPASQSFRFHRGTCGRRRLFRLMWRDDATEAKSGQRRSTRRGPPSAHVPREAEGRVRGSQGPDRRSPVSDPRRTQRDRAAARPRAMEHDQAHWPCVTVTSAVASMLATRDTAS